MASRVAVVPLVRPVGRPAPPYGG